MMLDEDVFKTILNLVTSAWLLGWAWRGLRNLLSPKRDSISFVLIVHFVLCGLPLLLDEAVGKTDYRLWPGFNIAAADGLTNFVFCAYVSACPLLWWWFGRTDSRRRRQPGMSTAEALRRLSWQGKTLLHCVLFTPLLALYLAPNAMAYREYAAIIRATLTPEELAFHPYVTACTLASALAGAALLLSQRNLKFTLSYALPIAFVVAWIDGKRTVVLIIFVMFGIALWARGALTKRGVAVWAPLLALAFAAFSVFYQGEFRGFGEVEWTQRYNNMRLDYGREHVMRQSIFAELHPETPPVLEYRMQSLLFDATMLVPREFWPEKPWPYAIYATAAAFRVPVRYLGWGVTTSWLEEAVANLGWPGFLVGPLLVGWICRLGDSQPDTIVCLLTILVSSMLLAVQVGALATGADLDNRADGCASTALRGRPGETAGRTADGESGNGRGTLMNVVVTLEHRFYRTPDGEVWTKGPNAYDFWTRYLAAFDEVKVAARVVTSPLPDLTTAWPRVRE